MWRFLYTTLVCLYLFCGINPGTETTNELRVYYPDGTTPASGVCVAFMPKGSNDRSLEKTVTTDNNGRFTVPKNLEAGEWAVMFTPADSEPYGALQEVEIFNNDSNSVRSDTLEQAGKISGVVALQPGDSHLLNAVTVQLLGTTRSVNADKEGNFTLSRIPSGLFTLRCQVPPQMSEYGYLDTELDRSNGRDTLLTDTLYIPFLGIPEVKGLEADFDSLSGIVQLHWDSIPANVDPDDYTPDDYQALILRKRKGEPTLAVDTLPMTSDNFFYDTIFTSDTEYQRCDMTDTIRYVLEYGVLLLRNSDHTLGKRERWIDVSIVSLCSETTDELRVYYPDGSPASDIHVAFMPKGSNDRSLEKTVTTDNKGRFTVPEDLETGEWAVMFTPANNEPYGALQEVEIFSNDSNSVRSDTLEPVGKISGVVALQPGDRNLLNAVTIQLLGTTRSVNADKEGNFTLSRVPSGLFTLRCQVPPQMSEYGHLDTELDRTTIKDTLLTDTLIIPFLGIPEVKGLEAAFDSLAGIVLLHWDSIPANVDPDDYTPDDYEALILRKRKGTHTQSIDTFPATGKNIFHDTIFTSDKKSQRYDITDTASFVLEYGVLLHRNSDHKLGKRERWVDIPVVSPYIYRTRFEIICKSAATGMKTRLIKNGDKFIIETSCINKHIPTARIVYSDLDNNSVLSQTEFSPPSYNVHDSITFDCTVDEPFTLSISAMNDSGVTIPDAVDTLKVLICESLTIGDLTNDNAADIDDALKIGRYLAEMLTFTEKERLIADVNQDNMVSIHDAQLISNYLNGITTNLPICFAVGDVNRDEMIDSVDLNLVSDHVNKKTVLDLVEIIIADVDGDTNVTENDVSILTDYCENKITEFPFDKK